MAIYTAQNIDVAIAAIQTIQNRFPIAGEAIGPVKEFLEECDGDVEQKVLLLMLQNPWGVAVMAAGLVAQQVEILFLD